MARDEPGKWIGATSGADGPDRFPVTDSLGNPAITGYTTLGNAKERTPDFQLERSRADESFQRGGAGIGVENGFGDAAGGTVVADEFGMRPVGAEFGGDDGSRRNIVKCNVADAARIPGE